MTVTAKILVALDSDKRFGARDSDCKDYCLVECDAV